MFLKIKKSNAATHFVLLFISSISNSNPKMSGLLMTSTPLKTTIKNPLHKHKISTGMTNSWLEKKVMEIDENNTN